MLKFLLLNAGCWIAFCRGRREEGVEVEVDGWCYTYYAKSRRVNRRDRGRGGGDSISEDGMMWEGESGWCKNGAREEWHI